MYDTIGNKVVYCKIVVNEVNPVNQVILCSLVGPIADIIAFVNVLNS